MRTHLPCASGFLALAFTVFHLSELATFIQEDHILGSLCNIHMAEHTGKGFRGWRIGRYYREKISGLPLERIFVGIFCFVLLGLAEIDYVMCPGWS